MKNITLILIVICVLLFSLYNKKIVCENNGLFVIIVIILFYFGIKNNNHLYEPFLTKEECENNCKQTRQDRNCPDNPRRPEADIDLTFNQVNDIPGTTSFRCMITEENKNNFERENWKNNFSKDKIISPNDNENSPIGWSWNINDPNGFENERECQKVCPSNAENDVSDNESIMKSISYKIKEDDRKGISVLSESPPFLENGFYYYGYSPNDKKKYCNVQWFNYENNEIITKYNDLSIKKQKYYDFADCLLNNIPRPKHFEDKKIKTWIDSISKNQRFYDDTNDNLIEYGKWIDELIIKINNGKFYDFKSGSINSKWCGPGFDPLSPINYDSIVDIKKCVTNTDWLHKNDKICFDAFYEKKTCEYYPNNAKNKWNNEKHNNVDETNKFEKLLIKMKNEILNEISNNTNTNTNNNTNNNNNTNTNNNEINLGSNLFQDFFQNLFSLNTSTPDQPNSINEEMNIPLDSPKLIDEELNIVINQPEIIVEELDIPSIQPENTDLNELIDL